MIDSNLLSFPRKRECSPNVAKTLDSGFAGMSLILRVAERRRRPAQNTGLRYNCLLLREPA